jgi:hypothetical protein
MDTMSVNHQWTLLRTGALREGIALIKQSFNETPSPSTLVTLGFRYLWSRNYQATAELFQNWMEKYQVTMEI